jgi:fluoride exporter
LLIHLLLAAAGGALGSSGRYLVGVVTLRAFGPGYPWGTFVVNIVGSALIGIFVELIARKFGTSADLRVFAVTGFLGGFTTFSAFSLDAANMMERGDLGLAAGYIGASVVLSLAALFGGLALVRAFG